MLFPISSACMTYMAIPISSWHQKFRSWDPGIHSTQPIKEYVLNHITRPLCGAFTHRKVSTCWPTVSFTKMILSETLHIKNSKICDLAAAINCNGKVLSYWKQSFIVCLYKGKGDAWKKGESSVLKLTKQVMKVLDRIMVRLRQCQSTIPSLALSQAEAQQMQFL